MIRSIFLTALLILFSTSLLWADELIVEPDRGRQPIIDALQTSKQSIQLVTYTFTDRAILATLIAQEARSKMIKIILENHPYKRSDINLKTIALLKKNNIDWHGSVPHARLVHQKTLVIDNQKAWVMTFNFTLAAFKKERNFALIIDDPNLVKDIANIFTHDWMNLPTPESYSKNILLSPVDSRSKLEKFINQAKTSLNIYAPSINDYRMIGLFAQAAKRGVKVNLLVSLPPKRKGANYLNRAGVNIKRSKRYFIHAKVMIADNQCAIVGSINFTRSSLDENRELAVITNDIKVVQQLNNVFNNDWNARV